MSQVGHPLDDSTEQSQSNAGSSSSLSRMMGNFWILESKNNLKIGVNKQTKQKVAIKVIPKEGLDELDEERARREIEIMSKLTQIGHPNITKLLFGEETESHFYLVQEYVAKGELLSYILKNKRLSEVESQTLFSQIIAALKCCHENNIVHRDIKHQNLLLDSNHKIKLIDFGFSSFIEQGVAQTTFCGTPAYAAPEILLGKPYDGVKIDMWSAGVVLYSMLAGEFPFKSLVQIFTGTFEEPEGVSEDCKTLLRGLLNVNCSQRFGLGAVLEHPWMKSALAAGNNNNKRQKGSGKGANFSN
jgi:5'-AMP-activated protein kinase catalytic alpha subunit